jgi:DNA-binding transcriptional MerR regulator
VTQDNLPIGQVARQAGVGIQTVRYYERRGLLPPPTRRPSGHRVYAPRTVTTLRAVKVAQRLGFTLAEVEEILRLSAGTGRRSDDLHARLWQKLQEIDERIGDLHAMRERLADALHAGCDSLTSCTCPSCPLLIQIETEGPRHAHRN